MLVSSCFMSAAWNQRLLFPSRISFWTSLCLVETLFHCCLASSPLNPTPGTYAKPSFSFKKHTSLFSPPPLNSFDRVVDRPFLFKSCLSICIAFFTDVLICSSIRAFVSPLTKLGACFFFFFFFYFYFVGFFFPR